MKLLNETTVTGFHASKVMILMWKTKKLEGQNWFKMQKRRHHSHHPCQTQEELVESFGVVRSIISMSLKALGMIQKQGN